ncbi:MAG: hypothetical protein NTV52_04320 [Acidobacteria bacterium]|nr:hypothetical protein [Acidobacteriota bacterium]
MLLLLLSKFGVHGVFLHSFRRLQFVHYAADIGAPDEAIAHDHKSLLICIGKLIDFLAHPGQHGVVDARLADIRFLSASPLVEAEVEDVCDFDSRGKLRDSVADFRRV